MGKKCNAREFCCPQVEAGACVKMFQAYAIWLKKCGCVMQMYFEGPKSSNENPIKSFPKENV